MATKNNLRLCVVKHEGKSYNVFIGVETLDDVDDILQEWAKEAISPETVLDLPAALISNTDVSQINALPKVDSYVYLPTIP